MWGSLGRCASVKTSWTTACSREVLILLSVSAAITLQHRCLVANMAWDPVASDGLVRTFLGLACGEDCTNVHLARLIAGIQKSSLDVHDISRAKDSADVLRYADSRANPYCSGTNKRISCIRSVLRTVSSRRRISGRTMELVSGHESLLTLSNRGALSMLMSASNLRERPTWFQESRWSVVRVEQRDFGRILCLLCSNWSLRWLDVCIGTDVSEKCFAFAVREGYR